MNLLKPKAKKKVLDESTSSNNCRKECESVIFLSIKKEDLKSNELLRDLALLDVLCPIKKKASTGQGC